MLENCRALLHVSRFYGCHPHTIREESATTTRTRARFHPLMLYSVIMCSVYCAIAYYANSVMACVPKGAMVIGCALQKVHRYSRNFYMIFTTVLSCLQHRHFENAVATAREFDHMMQHHRRRVANDVPVNKPRRLAQWLTLLGIHVTWTVCGRYSMYARSKVPWFLLLLQTAVCAAFAVQVAKFCFLYDALRRRFRLINQLCCESPDIVNPPTVRRVATRKRHRQGMTVGENAGASGLYAEKLKILHLQQLHRCLIDATDYLISYYNPQLFCWIVCIVMDILTFAFFISFTAYEVHLVVSQSAYITYLLIEAVAISYICHLTCSQANALGNMVFSMGNSTLGHGKCLNEAIELGVYLQVYPLYIKVFGLFSVNNRFAFSVLSMMIMYVILASSLQ